MSGTVSDQIIAGGAALYATNPATGDIYRYNGSPMNWTRVGGPGSMFAANNSTLYGVAPDKSALFQWTGTPDQWIQIRDGTDKIIAAGNALYATNPATGDIYQYNGVPLSWTLIETFSYVGSDGSALTLTRDTQGNITEAEGVGTDGVKHRFTRIFSFNKNRQGWYYGVMRQEFFENDQRYFYVTTMIFLWGRKVSMSMSGGGKDYGLSINFPDNGSHNQTTITITSGAMGQQFTVTKGTLSLNQGSISSPSITADFAVPSEIAQPVSKIAYFQPLFERENEQTATKAALDLQAAGIDLNMTPNQALYGQGAGQGFTKTQAKGACAVAAVILGYSARLALDGLLTLAGIPGGDVFGQVTGAIVGAATGVACSSFVDNTWAQGNPPSPPPDNPDMSPMPPEASVPMDNGADMSSSDGGGFEGICIGSPEGEARIIHPFDLALVDIGDCS